MISWAVVAYGAVLTAVAVFLLIWFAGRERHAVAVASTVAAAVVAVVVWNTALKVTSSAQFFTDFPLKVFPISWQDAGSGVFTIAAVGSALGFGPHRDQPARRVAALAALAGAGALLVDMYLY